MERVFVKHDIPLIERVDSSLGRRYKTPEGNLYPSVTTILSKTQDNSWLEEWKNRVGEEAANKITKEAADRGTFLHSCCENYLTDRPVKFHFLQHLEKEMFDYFKPVLNSIKTIHALETPLWSDKLKCAGTVDLIAEYKGKLCVLDWKNSLRYKAKEDIPNYFIQMSAYAGMFYERTGLKINDLVVVISVKDYGLVVHEDKTEVWIPQFMKKRKQYED